MPSYELLTVLVTEFTAIFFFILIFGYLLPCGQMYYSYFVRSSEEKEQRRIQDRRPKEHDIRREVTMSLQAILIFSIMCTGLFEMYKAGLTSIYWDTFQYPLYYLPISFFLCLVLHDTMFYWTHRFMHWRPVFKYFHAGHHRSVSPTPWAIFAFQPLEAITQFACLMLIVVFVPLKPIVLLAYLSYDSMINVAGHTGYEMIPKWLSNHWMFRGFNNVTHHDNHHTNMRFNYGAFFNVWDRWMGTFLDNGKAESTAGSTAESTAAAKQRSSRQNADAVTPTVELGFTPESKQTSESLPV
jgi:sterol desaturase/sphingolipid hydroxylase (fatty acid hydroxylase superfamily)